MNKMKVLSLRDLAIAHFPKAREKRAEAIRFHGSTFADDGLLSAYLFGNAEATAVEKQAIELLQLTFMHPNARPMFPLKMDAEFIASEARTVKDAIEIQPQIEAAMLNSARLLCELTGDALPPWVDGTMDQVQTPPVVATSEPLIMKKAALIAKLKSEGFAEPESAFRHSEINGLRRAAKTDEHGYWYVNETISWFEQNQPRANQQKDIPNSSGMIDQLRVMTHKIK